MWRAFLLGFVTGLRSQVPAAVLAWRESRDDLPAGVAGPGGLLRRRGAPSTLVLAAVGEMVADKLPQVPSRLDGGPFAGRLTLGATTGAGVAAAFGGSRIIGGALGLAGAAAGSHAGARYRAWAAAREDIPDLACALGEDVAAVALALTATRPGGA